MGHESAGVHVISNTVAAHAREISVVMDPWWRLGKEHGAAMVPAYHPVFGRSEQKMRHYKIVKLPEDDGGPLQTGRPVVVDTWKSPLRQEGTYRLQGGGQAIIKAQAEQPRPTRARSAGCLFACSGSNLIMSKRLRERQPEPSKPIPGSWQSRATCSSFEGWSNNLPLTHAGDGRKRQQA
mmetsp:Transcript_1499/g.3158  ORF Transcript_1499/g.3158 Transcript_1499/m.3158 type:complete len:180 (-) Transcript_1499:75-614(-)